MALSTLDKVWVPFGRHGYLAVTATVPDSFIFEINMKFCSKKQGNSLKPIRGSGKSPSCFCLFPKIHSACQTQGGVPVYLNVYDLTSMNDYIRWAGIGVFHCGVEVYGVEYAFGVHSYPTSGIFEVEPRRCPGFRFRKAIFMGMTSLNPNQVSEFMERQSLNYTGDTYHLITKNCNHFCKDICYKLTGNSIPKWVNRLARIGAICSNILPKALKVSAVRQIKDYESQEGEKQRLRPMFQRRSSI
ncbi:PPPDE peptidase domain-containing protein [Dioscorea alata]|uniref:PPPDE peptidase domain-containing protein n=3 Tax=Dioscorea alata TaxID=55571 RepID=A0ACB7VMV8_DIOAL|nr:PPPDE peptidase domain-containing protein [Dioscorea alata]